jgi:hypothetical protein
MIEPWRGKNVDSIGNHRIGCGQDELPLFHLLKQGRRPLLLVGIISGKQANNDIGVDKRVGHVIVRYLVSAIS